MPAGLRLTKFKDVDLSDPLFDSLKSQYEEFRVWFASKANQPVYVIDDDQADQLRGFLYVKVETEEITDIQPALPAARRLKVGTMKVIAHGTKLGERVIKKIFDHAIAEQVEEIYVTVFDTHQGLIDLFKRYGFKEKGSKTTKNGIELVLLRDLNDLKGDMVLDYPFVHTDAQRVFLLAIYPDYHTKLLPDSILHNENPNLVEDVSHTNTIHKIYIAKLALGRMKKGDIVVIYRTTDRKGQARYRSVATSICVVEQTFSRRDFATEDDFVEFARRHSVFPEDELRAWYTSGDRLFGVKMTYNAALQRRVIRDVLLGDVAIPEQPRWDLKQIDHDQLRRIAELGKVDPRLLVP